MAVSSKIAAMGNSEVISAEVRPTAGAPWGGIQFAGVLDDALDHLGWDGTLREPADMPQSLV